jgi:leucyl-tRNA synthetase
MSPAEWDRAARTFVLLLAALAPHLAEELWARLGGEYSVHEQPWPEHDRGALEASAFTLIMQVNGRVRDRATAPPGITAEQALKLALGSEKVRRYLDERNPRHVVFVPDRLINLLS